MLSGNQLSSRPTGHLQQEARQLGFFSILNGSFWYKKPQGKAKYGNISGIT